MEGDTRGGLSGNWQANGRFVSLRLGVIVLGADIVALLEEFIPLFLQCLRHLVVENEWLATSRRGRGKSRRR